MKILIAPHGTRGDVQPVVALGLALARRGHHVEVAAPENFGAWISGLGLRFHPVGGDVEATIRTHGPDTRKLSWQLRRLREVLVPAQYEALPRVCPDADVILGAGLQFAAASVAQQRGIPYFFNAICPVGVPSAHHPAPPLPWQGMPRFFNRLTWWFGDATTDLLLRAPMNRGRAGLGLPPISSPSRFLRGYGTILLAADTTLAPPPPDAPENLVATDAWQLDARDALEPGLLEYLEAGPAPVFLGFGSMDAGDPERVLRMVLEARERAGSRLLLGAGWSGLGQQVRLPPGCRVVGPVPHDVLFPRLAAVVHHGGAGTTTTAARAGVPQLIVPHLFDQFYWGHRVHALGLGPKPLPIHRLTAAGLASRLAEVLEDRYRARAADLAAEIREHDGITAAAQVIEAHVSAPEVSRRVGSPAEDRRGDRGGAHTTASL